MSDGNWYSQCFRPDGGSTAEGLRDQLGRPSLSLLNVLVRESAQNAWDARALDEVTFRLDLASTDPAETQAWRELLGPGLPHSTDFPLDALLQGNTIPYLAVSDRGTAGLGGPTRSDVPAEPGRRNWLSFVLNSGEKRDVEGGGGTYGYGKGAFFLASRVGSITIYTRFLDDDRRLRSRLIISALWHSSTEEPLHTGRHWWGNAQTDHCEPLLDRDADLVSGRLGLPRFEEGETGTTVVVLDPDLTDPEAPDDESTSLSMNAAGRLLADAAAWNLWPIMMLDRSPRLRVEVIADSVAIPVPSEADDATLAAFAAAYRNMSSPDGEDVTCGRPRAILGRFGYEATLGASVESAIARDLGVQDAPHHICLLRHPDLVVQYFEGPRRSHPAVGYAGVFKAADDLDSVFAKAEPPTHDGWIAAQLHGHEATFVRVARRRVAERCDELAGTRPGQAAVADTPVGAVAHRLGFLLSGVGGHGIAGGGLESQVHFRQSAPSSHPSPPAGGDGPTGAGTSSRASQPVLVGGPRFEDFEGRSMLVQRVRTTGAATLIARALVITGEGTPESSAPEGGQVPEIRGWRTRGVVHGDSTFVVEQAGTELDLLVVPVVDAVIEISVRATP